MDFSGVRYFDFSRNRFKTLCFLFLGGSVGNYEHVKLIGL